MGGIADVDGGNITNKKLKLDTTAGGNAIRHAAMEEKNCVSNSMAYAVGTYSECVESDSNDNISSAATARNIMAELEEKGFLKSPHTSAGRIPTPRGYRLFVDNLIHVEPVEAAVPAADSVPGEGVVVNPTSIIKSLPVPPKYEDWEPKG